MMPAGDITAADERDDNPIPLSALQHAVYCPRQAALIHLERVWAENRFTAEGHVNHLNIDRATARSLRGIRRVTSLPIACRRLGIAGVADLVEFRPAVTGEIPFPVEFKRGKSKLHRADEVQLCAQALCLEEMMDSAVPEGALYYAETSRRVIVAFDGELRKLTEETVKILAEMFANWRTPAPTTVTSRCRSCSLIDLCRPSAVAKRAKAWRRRVVDSLLNDREVPP